MTCTLCARASCYSLSLFCLVRDAFSRTEGTQVGTLSNVLTMHVSFLSREKNVAPDTCAAGVAP